MLDKNTIKRWMLEDGGKILFDPQNPGVFSGYVTFTRERAEMALENNTHNRGISTMNVNILIDSIKAGYWDDSVSKICFADDGSLSDGQHRLVACIKCGIPIRALVTWGVSCTAQNVIDRRGTRKLKDDMEIAGYKNVKALAGLTRLSYFKEKGVDVKTLVAYGRSTAIADVVLFNYFLAHQDQIIEEQRLAESIRRRVKDLSIPAEVLNILSVEFDKINKLDAETFWSRLSAGYADYEGDPIFLLRKRLVENTKSTTNKIPKIVMAALIIKAWNFYEKGESIKNLSYRSGGSSPEAFPEIYNPYEFGGDE